ncbi:FAD-dependent oxidoreductase [Saccharopolyspora karakumensis]|uniref:FAD-dependent oxidoreductase n=1 Tax=Saccharopolyspora karakumensis TaxID=2530386 RepID=A0A4R5BUF7_9PSEU|nr:FAD-dependent oxidoreductase [Saccharopolyspora karakumensis]TDD89163.1 FAD-dependent oxidoreductase [Saccharopolyspora karakumensis]
MGQQVDGYDVVVVGGGVAGLSAACAAAEAGARVALLERAVESESGGNTRYTEAFLRMKSVEQTADGLEDSLVEDFMGHPDPGVVQDAALLSESRQPSLSKAHHVIDLDYVAEFSTSAPATLAWMTGHGVKFEFLPTPFLTTSTSRMAPVGGGLAIVEVMGEAARGLGVEFLFETTARSLLVEDGEVRGVSAKTAGGWRVFRGRVVLASGGYQGNAEMMARYHGDKALTTRPVARGGNYNKGEGIEMALAAGAATAGNFSLFHAEPVDPRSGEPEAAIFCFPHGILVNEEGERFVDEARGPIDAWYERTTRDIHAQTGGIAWVLLDQQSLAVPNIMSGVRTGVAPVSADSVAALAEKLGLPVDRLQATVAAYNDACQDGPFDHTVPDGLATRGLEPAKSNWARPLVKGPFVAYPIMAAAVFTFGGLKTTAAAEVVDRDGRPIVGLYAAGEVTGLYYSNYTGSTSVLRGATFGKIAGGRAAALSALSPEEDGSEGRP